ncbi:MAG: hypothetical protein KF893_09015 [Caldilineaceae bacterium]|nr:hypothetical protein [Caldilineaceae bacterium]
MTGGRRWMFWLLWGILAAVGLYALGETVYFTAQEGREGLGLAEMSLNFGLRLIPVVLLTFAFGLFIVVLEEEFELGRMKERVRRLLFWTPRLALLLFALLLSLFALDVFGQGAGFWETLLALLMHLIPTGVLLIVVVLAWRWEWVGTFLLTAWAIAYLVMTSGFPLSVYLMMSGLPFMLGLLFWLNWHYRAEVRLAA